MDLEISSGNNYVILGANGSGKSTLLQLIAGNSIPSEGKIVYSDDSGKEIPPENIFSHLSFASPYLELFEEFTLQESIRFHSRFKKLGGGLNAAKVTEICYLENAVNKRIRDFSSGMKQRVKLALAILSDTPLLLLDEPCSNLDQKGVDWYNALVEEHKQNRLIIVCSNLHPEEYRFCNQQIRVEDYKVLLNIR
jgi:ABC-type multidrug transport system ATPase subunit